MEPRLLVSLPRRGVQETDGRLITSFRKCPMRDYFYLGSSPCEEPCVQVTSDGGYIGAMRAECRRFIDLIRRVLGPEPEGARLTIKREEHDFGSYFEVVCHFDTDLPESVEYACRCESDAPTRWDVEPTSDSLHSEGL